MKLQTLIGVMVFITAAAVVAGGKYLAEQPDILTPCLQSDPGFNRCFGNNLQSIFAEWKDGIPGLKTVGSIDPIHVKRVSIAEDGNGPVSINIDLRRIVLEGLSHTIVEDANYNPKKVVSKFHIKVPKLDLSSDYDVSGRILTLPLNGNGKTRMTIENLQLEVNIRLKLRTEYGLTFTDVEKLKVFIKDVGGFHINLDNLFNGEKVLEETANGLFNDNWRDLFDSLRPSITGAIQSVMDDRFTKIFAYVPATYFIGDLESGA